MYKMSMNFEEILSYALENFEGQAFSTAIVNYCTIILKQKSVTLNGTHQFWFMLMMLIYWEEEYIL